ncbi:unnamed protein product [Paramecium octaurelia]|uniref:Uncharacterized protein n=1 Tax=Paramecium octaurelia TaxID=43137 RepID=A0A8S1V0J4_PAROT|nr:unnamed protein product [Paramecium octaurelia]
MNNFHNYRANRIFQKSVKQRSAQKVNQLRASLKSNESVNSVTYNIRFQREARIKTQPQQNLVSEGTIQNLRFNQLRNHINDKSFQIKQERYKKQPRFPRLNEIFQNKYSVASIEAKSLINHQILQHSELKSLIKAKPQKQKISQH